MSYSPSSAPSCSACSRAFSSEVDPGSRQENASKQETRAPFQFNRNGKGASRSRQHHVFQSQDVFLRKHYSRRQNGGCAAARPRGITASGFVPMRLPSLPQPNKPPPP